MRPDDHKAFADRTRGRQPTMHTRDGGATELKRMSVGYLLESTPRVMPHTASARSIASSLSITLPPVAELLYQFVPMLLSVASLLMRA